MTQQRIVLVPVHCSRKNKEVNAKVPAAEMSAFIEGLDKRARNSQVIAEQLKSIPPDDLPHLLVVYKGQVVVLPTVHDSNDDAVKHALNAAINDKVFPVPEPVKRGPRGNGEAADTATPTAE